MKKIGLAIILIGVLSSFYLYDGATLKGTWEYEGGIYNDKAEGPPDGYSLQRVYNDSKFDAFVREKGLSPEKYEAGNYSLNNDTCFETQTYCSQPSKLIGKTVRYIYKVKNDTLTLKGILPAGMEVVEYWKKIK